jgi:hypothetical protein
LTCQVIEGAAEVFDDVPGDTNGREGQYPKGPEIEDRAAEFSGREVLGLHAQDSRIVLPDWCLELFRRQIRIGKESIKLFVPKSDDFRLQIQEVLLGPANFYPNQNQSVVGRKWHK